MTRLRLAALILITVGLQSTPVHGAGGYIGIVGSPWPGMECNLLDRADDIGLYVVHDLSDGTLGVRFSAPLPACWTGATFLVDQVMSPFIAIGDSQSGIQIAYGSCVVGQIVVARIWITSMGAMDFMAALFNLLAFSMPNSP